MATRIAVVAAALMIAGALAASVAATWMPEKSAKKLTLVYVGAENCAPCEIWQRDQGDSFRHSAKFRRVIYREVKSSSLFDVLKDETWPEDLRIYRHAIGKEAGVPLWLVIADERLVMQGFGLSQWQAAVLPKIKSLLR